MSQQPAEFIDFYELLQLSPNAEPDTIQRVFRLLAQRYHPDNHETGNEHLFQQLLKAYQTLSDPASRAAYDARHREHVKKNWEVFDKDTAPQSRDAEIRKREGILGVLYRKRQTTPATPGMNVKELEDVLGIPREHLEFTIWYLKESGQIKPGDNGRYAISIKGVDAYEGFGPSRGAASPDDAELYLLPAAKPRAS